MHSPRLVLDLHPCMLKHCPVSRHHPPHLCCSWWSLCPMGYGDQLPLQYCFFFLGPNGPYELLPLLSWSLCIILLLLIFTCKELTIQDLDVGQNVIIGSWEKNIRLWHINYKINFIRSTSEGYTSCITLKTKGTLFRAENCQIYTNAADFIYCTLKQELMVRQDAF